jgi:hypothetical protein
LGRHKPRRRWNRRPCFELWHRICQGFHDPRDHRPGPRARECFAAGRRRGLGGSPPAPPPRLRQKRTGVRPAHLSFQGAGAHPPGAFLSSRTSSTRCESQSMLPAAQPTSSSQPLARRTARGCYLNTSSRLRTRFARS